LSSDLRDVFNDLSLHLFNAQHSPVTDDDNEFWSDADEPRYCGNEFDEEIVWNKQSPYST